MRLTREMKNAILAAAKTEENYAAMSALIWLDGSSRGFDFELLMTVAEAYSMRHDHIKSGIGTIDTHLIVNMMDVF